MDLGYSEETMSPSKRFSETVISVHADIQDLLLNEQCCEECGASFFFMEARDGDCSHQTPVFCPLCGRRAQDTQ